MTLTQLLSLNISIVQYPTNNSINANLSTSHLDNKLINNMQGPLPGIGKWINIFKKFIVSFHMDVFI